MIAYFIHNINLMPKKDVNSMLQNRWDFDAGVWFFYSFLMMIRIQ